MFYSELKRKSYERQKYIKLGVRLIYRSGLYIDFYGISVLSKSFFFTRTQEVFGLKPDPNMITLSLYKEILNVFSNMQTFSVVVDTVMLCLM